MINVTNIEVWGFEHAIRGMRNPMNSWSKSDTEYCYNCGNECCTCEAADKGKCGIEGNNSRGVIIGDADLDLMKRLFKAGTEHRKYLRQIFVSLDIDAPLYWWKEYDTYKVSTTANSCSTMHKIQSKEFTRDTFSCEHLSDEKVVTINGVEYSALDALDVTIGVLNAYRDRYNNDGKNKADWWNMIQSLPSTFNQKRTLTLDYETVFSIIRQRTNHKIDDWNVLVKILRSLPFVEDILDENADKETANG